MQTTWKVVTRPGGTCQVLVWWALVCIIVVAAVCLIGVATVYYHEGTLSRVHQYGLLIMFLAGIIGMYEAYGYVLLGLVVVGVPLMIVWMVIKGFVEDYRAVTKQD